MNINKILLFLVFCPGLTSMSFSQTGSVYEPIRYVGGETIDPNLHEGKLRYAIGVESRQTIRVNRTHPDWVDACGWTYSHASNIAYWNNQFYQQYLSNPIDEHIPEGQTLITTSKDGRNWGKPEIVFPPYVPPSGIALPDSAIGYMMHQRMGFYIAPNGSLLILGFYGHAEDPFRKGGIGRVVREAYKDGRYGPIYFIRYDSHTNWNETNTSYPFYKTSHDNDFLKACNELLANKLVTMQWWDEDAGLDGFYSIREAGSAFNYYRRKDGKITALWKRSMTALSDDSEHFSKPVKVPSLTMAGGKIWGQATEDGKYALCYNPIELDEHRYPLIIVTSVDGIIFDDMLLVQGEVPPRRFMGRWKDFGPCYMRGIVQGNGNPPGNDMWLSYSMNKEDIWISRIPTPIEYSIKGNISDNFNNMTSGGAIANWNIYSPQWAPIEVVDFPSIKNKSLVLKDRDPYDYARAIRVFEETQKAEIEFKILPKQTENGVLEIDVTDRYGNRPVRIKFDSDGKIKAGDGNEEIIVQTYNSDSWYNFKINIDTNDFGTYALSVNGIRHIKNAKFVEVVKSVERISFRTGRYRDLPNRKTPNQDPAPPLKGADEPLETAAFHLDDLKVKKE